MKIQHFGLLAAGLLFISACSNDRPADSNASKMVSGSIIRKHIAVLADDSLSGRKPFSEGEYKTIAYISGEMKKIGLEPGNHGSYYQDVPLVEISSIPDEKMRISGGNGTTDLQFKTEFVASTQQELPLVELRNSALIFAGYGVVAPEYGWNDYAGIDVKGKTVMVLVNDPGYKSNDPTFFKGDTMTYYGRWTYKYEEAARQGAAGVIIVHQTEPASYGWNVIESSFTGSMQYLTQKDKHLSRCKVEGWITEDAAKRLLMEAGIKGDMREIARKKDFKAMPLNRRVSLTLHNKMKYDVSHNVIGLLKGRVRPEEYVLYSAHWDHLGVGLPDAKGDSIYNGAVDNADGVASMLAVAQAFAAQKEKPERSILFLAVTAEEQGLLGSAFYASHPVFPLQQTVCDLNMDALGSYGETKDLNITGKGQNDLEDYVTAFANSEGLLVRGDQNPGSGGYFRSDHFSFAKQGVPALEINTGNQSKTRDSAYIKNRQKEYGESRYHQQADNYTPDMDVSGMVEIADLLYRIGWQISNESTFPGWRSGSEFKAIREKTRPADTQE